MNILFHHPVGAEMMKWNSSVQFELRIPDANSGKTRLKHLHVPVISAQVTSANSLSNAMFRNSPKSLPST
jgi:hypothetical protein